MDLPLTEPPVKVCPHVQRLVQVCRWNARYYKLQYQRLRVVIPGNISTIDSIGGIKKLVTVKGVSMYTKQEMTLHEAAKYLVPFNPLKGPKP